MKKDVPEKDLDLDEVKESSYRFGHAVTADVIQSKMQQQQQVEKWRKLCPISIKAQPAAVVTLLLQTCSKGCFRNKQVHTRTHIHCLHTRTCNLQFVYVCCFPDLLGFFQYQHESSWGGEQVLTETPCCQTSLGVPCCSLWQLGPRFRGSVLWKCQVN